MIRTLCDVCGEALTSDIVRLRVEDYNMPKPGEAFMRLALNRDFHRACFIKDIQPKLAFLYSEE